ncbi:uncharacterized protein LOC100014675 isoform X2 [Monodelphis domestica]|uniref:uncharacterized protein LOC100014675 isoform X2 n=1 Tax=Monodelphis domestica TaxID=13616 RepID=UPI0024E1F718|nr:uncharacterized protein LOC100014675 isoform X2 [Monodelphis domestica]XP_056665292.1 uncharacterized protein LOC100014675 isoform X2 [Monodelphis domestica]XP_056665293.1 uncharacterized protein LOC100014675 isoform X2 [Monodelphis domestica]
MDCICGRVLMDMSQKDPCQKQACDIQKCLQAERAHLERKLEVLQGRQFFLIILQHHVAAARILLRRLQELLTPCRAGGLFPVPSTSRTAGVQKIPERFHQGRTWCFRGHGQKRPSSPRGCWPQMDGLERNKYGSP